MKYLLVTLLATFSLNAHAGWLVDCNLATASIGGSMNQSIKFMDQDGGKTMVNVMSSNFDMNTGDRTKIEIEQPGYDCSMAMTRSLPPQLISGSCERTLNGVTMHIDIEPAQNEFYSINMYMSQMPAPMPAMPALEYTCTVSELVVQPM